MTPVDYEARFHLALRRIMAYMTPAQLRRSCEKSYGLEYEEALEYAYENVRGEAQAALKWYRPKRQRRATTTKPDAVDPVLPSSVDPTPRA